MFSTALLAPASSAPETTALIYLVRNPKIGTNYDNAQPEKYKTAPSASAQ